jgi:hypothetical protein
VTFRFIDNCERLARELLARLCTTQSNSAVVRLFCKWFKAHPRSAGETLHDVFAAVDDGKRNPQALGTLIPFSVHTLPSICDEFVLDFDVVLDFPTLHESNASVLIIAIEDKFQSRLSLFVNQQTLYGQWMSPHETNMCALCTVKAAKRWLHVRIAFMRNISRFLQLNVSIVLNNIRPCAATLRRGVLSEAVAISLGGHVGHPSNEWCHRQLGSIANVSMANSADAVV